MKKPTKAYSPVLSNDVRYLCGEGGYENTYQWLGAHPLKRQGQDGVLFVVWAPNALSVAVVGNFNDWDGTGHAMHEHAVSGLWELFVPGLAVGAIYKYEIYATNHTLLPLKADPYAFAMQHPPETASMVWSMDSYQWQDKAWMESRNERTPRNEAVAIYEVHLASWKRVVDEDSRYLTYHELADQLIPYVKEMGFTHLQLMPVSEYPFDGSWGYQPIGLFAPTSRFGSPDDFKYFIDSCHQAGLAVLLDWVPGHFPTDQHGLGRFDGTCLYEHQDKRRGFHPDWNTLIYDYGRKEVISFLISNALFWLDQYHIDGLRVDAVASMLYLDYSRKEGEWFPNTHGGRENLEAIDLLQKINEQAFGNYPMVTTIAEESTAWPGVSHPTYSGGLGFGYKWNMGWMHDTLQYMSRDPVHRKFHHNDIKFGLEYAFSENFVLPLSHDEVVHGKGSLLTRMPGDDEQAFANLRAYFGFMWTHPGKKLLFMGGEFAQRREWNHDAQLDWQLLDNKYHAGVRRLVMDLNGMYQDTPALHQQDCEAAGFEWIEVGDHARSVYAYLRKSATGAAPVIVVCNFTPQPRDHYRVGVQDLGPYKERFNSDAKIYGGTGRGNRRGVKAQRVASQGRPYSISFTLPPMTTLVFQRADHEK